MRECAAAAGQLPRGVVRRGGEAGAAAAAAAAAAGRQIRAARSWAGDRNRVRAARRSGVVAHAAPTRFACAPATAASFRSPIPEPAAAPTVWRMFAGRCAPTLTWRSIRSRSAATIDGGAASGEPYANLPNAGKFEQSYDPSCSCRRKGESWAEALADAEARYGHEKHDIIVTPEKSAEMARPIIDPKAKPAVDPKAKPGASLVAGPGPRPAQRPARRRRATLRMRRCSISTGPTPSSAPRPPPSAARPRASPATTSRAQRASPSIRGETVESTGPDGVKRTVRIVGPSL